MKKKQSSPFATGGGGIYFEANVQALYVALMLTRGCAPGLPCWPICKIILQGKVYGYETDDIIVFVDNTDTAEQRKMLGQIKNSIDFRESDQELQEFFNAAWSDFCNKNIFNRNSDAVALITGPLSRLDFDNIYWILNQARSRENTEDFYNLVYKARFSPTHAKKKLDVIENKLKIANGGVAPSKDEIFSFLKHFYVLGYDFNIYGSVVEAFVISHISQFNKKYPEILWSKIINYVQKQNKGAGVIAWDNLPSDLKQEFVEPKYSQFPPELAPQGANTTTNWSQHQHATQLALLNFIGSWNEDNQNDIKIVTRLLGDSYPSLVLKIREALNYPDTPLTFQDGIWMTNDRVALWNTLAERVFVEHLRTTAELATEVLTERNPAFDLPAEQRFAANVYDKTLSYSTNIRSGLAESLALMGNYSDIPVHCKHYGKDIAQKAIREIFKDADWERWASLDHLLPTLAEAAPDEFLSAMRASFSLDPCPFDGLYANELSGIMGRSYISGLLWALERLAWDEDYLVRVCVILGELASRDPGGRWANRPLNSLTTILLPWIKHTIASAEKQKVAVETLCKEQPDVAWKLLITLLPNQHQTTTGTDKPVWRKVIPNDWDDRVTTADYWKQIRIYAEIAVDQAGNNMSRLNDLIQHLDSLLMVRPAFDRLITILASDEILRMPDIDKLQSWNSLNKFIIKHKRLSGEDWSLKGEALSLVESAAEKLAARDSFYRYQYLFADDTFDLYDDLGDYKEQEKRLISKREQALKDIIISEGFHKVIELVRVVKSSYTVGFALGNMAEAQYDNQLLPEYLAPSDKALQHFMNGYIWSRFRTLSFEWVDQFCGNTWDLEKKGFFLSLLPFNIEVWNRVSQWLGESEEYYWKKVDPRPHHAVEDLSIAIDKLLSFGRPKSAIHCLYVLNHEEKSLDIKQCIKALLDALRTNEPSYSWSYHEVIDIIQYLQMAPETPQDELFKTEFAYLDLLDGTTGSRPKALEMHLAESPEFFCSLIQTAYRSDKNDQNTDEVDEGTKQHATIAWKLLHVWKIPPGMQKDGSFNDTDFIKWIERAWDISEDSGHLEIALSTIGGVLIYSPPDIDLWINRSVADVLNRSDAERLRHGYSIGEYNSRGVRVIDPTGAPEDALARQYKIKADEIENAGYYLFAETLRHLSDGYAKEAEQIRKEHAE